MSPELTKTEKGKKVRELPFGTRAKIYSATNHGMRMAILKRLAKKNPASFSELEEALKKPNPNTLTHHLRTLREALLVTRKLKLDKKSKRYSMYGLTPLGHEVLAVKDLTTIL